MAEYHRSTQTVKTKEDYTRGSQRERDRIADEIARTRPNYPPEVIASFRLTKFWARLYSMLLDWHSSETMSKPFCLWDDRDRDAARRALNGVALAAHSTEIVDLVRAAHAEIDLVDLWEEQRPKAIDDPLAKLSQAINLIERGSRQ